MIVISLISKFLPSQIAEYFIEASKEMMFGALIIGLSYGIPVVMDKAKIIDAIVYTLATMLQDFHGMISAIGMLFV